MSVFAVCMTGVCVSVYVLQMKKFPHFPWTRDLLDTLVVVNKCITTPSADAESVSRQQQQQLLMLLYLDDFYQSKWPMSIKKKKIVIKIIMQKGNWPTAKLMALCGWWHQQQHQCGADMNCLRARSPKARASINLSCFSNQCSIYPAKLKKRSAKWGKHAKWTKFAVRKPLSNKRKKGKRWQTKKWNEKSIAAYSRLIRSGRPNVNHTTNK